MKKSCSAFCLLAASIGFSPLLSAQSATYSFSDPSIHEGEVLAFQVGDVIGGEVSIDLATGDYTVTWFAHPDAPFPGNQQFALILGNREDGSIVEMVHAIPDFISAESLTFSGNEATLRHWLPGDTLVTFGGPPEFSSAFQSGTFSLDPWALPPYGSDPVSHIGVLVGESRQVDSDGDGIPDDLDLFPDSDMSDSVILFGINTGIENVLDGQRVSESGATLADVIQALVTQAAAQSKNHGRYVATLTRDFQILVHEGWITRPQAATLVRLVASNK